MKKKLPKKFIQKKAVVYEKKQRSKIQFPSLSRLIPEIAIKKRYFSPKIFFLSFFCGFLLMAIASQAYAIIQDTHMLTSIQEKQEKVKQEIAYWEQVVSIHKDYRDGYFKLALLAQQVGDKKRAKEYVEKSLELDPDFTLGRSYQVVLDQ